MHNKKIYKLQKNLQNCAKLAKIGICKQKYAQYAKEFKRMQMSAHSLTFAKACEIIHV